MSDIIVNEKGQKVVRIGTIIFSSKRRIDWVGVEDYLKRYVGEEYVIDETNDVICIGSEFPDEYTHSKDSNKSLGTIGKAKANISQAIPELIQIAANVTFSMNYEQKHSKNAKHGWLYCIVRFILPITDDKKNIIGQNYFRGRMVIRCDQNGKKYLYDIVDIKKET